MVLNAENKRMLAEAASKLKVGAGPSGANAATPTNAPTTVVSAPNPSASAPADLRQKGVVEAIASKDEDTCSGLVFKRKMGVDVVVPALSASDGGAPSFQENPPSASSPRDMVAQEGGEGECPWR